MLDKKDDSFFDEVSPEDTAAAELLKMIEADRSPLRTSATPGEKVSGKVTRLGSGYAFVDIGGKNEAMISLAEFAAKGGAPLINAGDSITAFVVSVSDGEMVLSRSLATKGAAASMQDLADAMNNQVPVQGKITGVNKGGLNVKVLGHRAFCPASQIDIRFTEDLNGFLGKSFDFTITRITEGGRNIVVSRIPLLEGELEKRIDELSLGIKAKSVIRGTISRIAEFGLFVDIGGCEGLVHISEVAWERTEKLDDRFSVGQEVECVVLAVEKKSPLRMSKISLSLKQVLDNPWTTVSSRFAIGQSAPGRVTKLMPFGAFVEIAPGIEGLVHVSEMSWVKRVHHPSDVVSVGQEVQVTIKGIDESKKTVSLSLKDLNADPWKDARSRFPVGTETEGTVARKAKFGYFVDLAEGVTGLLPLAHIAPDKKSSISENSTITVRIESVDDAARRISLSFGIKEEVEATEEVKKFLAQQGKPAGKKGSSASSEFGTALLDALKKKK